MKIGGIWWIVGASAAVAVIVGATFALTAGNTVPESQAGAGANTISGYEITNIHYNLNSSDPTKIDSVSFDVDTEPPADSTIRVKLVSTGSDWYTCTNTGTNITCDTTTPQANVAPSDEFEVVIAQ
ncbi:MAG: hypothetical protein ACOC5M_03845 [Chloroflexota bacterium]